MLKYFLISGILYKGTALLFKSVINNSSDMLGYVQVLNDPKPSVGKRIFDFALVCIPIIGIPASIFFLGLSLFVTFSKPDLIRKTFDKNIRFAKASEAKEILERRQEQYNLKDLEDMMKLDGADEETIKTELKQVKKEDCVVSDKEMKKVKAMSDAELWLQDIESDITLTDNEKIDLYTSYVKDFSKEKSRDKAIQKTLKLVKKK